MDSPTFEQIDAAFRSFDAAKHQANLKQAAAQGVPASAASLPICPIYKAVRPFLQAAASLPFIPAAWRAAITAFISTLDLLCPGS